MSRLVAQFKALFALTKPLQTALLLITGLAGYMSARCPVMHFTTLLEAAGSLVLAIAGSTLLNMWFDRDIDACMERTRRRPLPSGITSPQTVLFLGLGLSAAGVLWGLVMSWLYGLLLLAGIFFDVVIYTIALKRRTCWSIIIGGIAGAMPILAGRSLGVGMIDWTGVAMALGVVFWIPTHIMTFSIKYQKDYKSAGVPTFPSTYGARTTQLIITVSSVLAALAMGTSAYSIGMRMEYICVLGTLSLGLFVLAGLNLRTLTERFNFVLFKYASVYMFSAMILLALEAL